MKTKRQLAQAWDEYVKNLRRETPVPFESEGEKKKRIKMLLGNFEKFCKYYFPNYCTAEFAAFHKRFAKKVIDNDVIYGVWALAREHAKSVVSGLFLPLFLKFNGRLKNMLLVSHSYDNAEELLMPIMMNLEFNQRIINDFGKQRSWRGWESGRFVTADSCSFRALGAKQSPRGTRNEEARPDYILVDDIDTDEESRNQKRIDDKWAWVEQALFPAMSISGSKRFLVVGNIISKESVVVKASRVADFFDTVNILDRKGKPSWHQRYTLEAVKYMLSKISYISQQKEYFNNPISKGTIFKDMRWGKVPPLKKFPFLVAYGDPSYKRSKKSDYKSVPLVGILNGTLYIIKAYLDQTTIRQMVKWYYYHSDYVNNQTTVYNLIEAGSLQDTFYKELFVPRLIDYGNEVGRHLPIGADHRSKPDKFTRIEASLQPLHEQGRMIFNEKEKYDPHMKRLIEQFEALEPSLPAHDDGPDSVEGGKWIIDHKLRKIAPIKVGSYKRSKYKF